MPTSLPIFGWVLLQTTAILLAAVRIRFWAHAPANGEFLAVPILLTVQIVGAGLLFPRLVDTWQSTCMAIATTWPFAAMVGLLSASPVVVAIMPTLYVGGWLVVLWSWRRVLQSPRSQHLAAGIAAGWSVAGPILLFIRNEYGQGHATELSAAACASLGPLQNTISMGDLTPKTHVAWSWMVLAILGILAGGMKWGRKSAVNPR